MARLGRDGGSEKQGRREQERSQSTRTREDKHSSHEDHEPRRNIFQSFAKGAGDFFGSFQVENRGDGSIGLSRKDRSDNEKSRAGAKEYAHLDKPLHRDSPFGWGKPTADMKKVFAETRGDFAVTQMVKIDKVDGSERAWGTLGVRKDGKVTYIPIVNGGHDNGALDEMVTGGKTKIVECGKHRLDSWGCKVYGLQQNFDGRSDVAMHAIARSNGTSRGCPAWPRSHQLIAESVIKVGMEVEMIRSTMLGGLAHSKETTRRLAEEHGPIKGIGRIADASEARQPSARNNEPAAVLAKLEKTHR